jgi:Plant transposon protein
MEERNNISKVMERRGFPGCLASWDCKHFNWKNCPMRLAGQHQGHSEGGKKTLILEAIADHRKHFWAANFGDAGSLNDLNVLNKSAIVGAMLSGDLRIDVEPYTINNNVRDWMYYLVDGIYPGWSIFVSSFNRGTTCARKRTFSWFQERVCCWRMLSWGLVCY